MKLKGPECQHPEIVSAVLHRSYFTREEAGASQALSRCMDARLGALGLSLRPFFPGSQQHKLLKTK